MSRTGLAIPYLLLLLPLTFLLPSPSSAQAVGNTPATSNMTAGTEITPLQQAILAYTRSNAAEARLYNGPIYEGYNHQATGHPFFLSDSTLIGSITYDGTYYPQLPLSYDCEKDLVIIPDRRHTVAIQLLTERLRYFTIGEHRFTHLLPDSTSVNAPAEGFYEVLYYGKATALVHHRKQVLASRAEENTSRYQQYETWYIERNGHYYPVHNNHDLLNAFGSDAVKDFVRKNHLNVKKAPVDALARTAEFYSQSNN